MRKNTLVLDLGSHSSRIALFSPQAECLHLDSIELHTRTEGNQVEQDPLEILDSFQSLLSALSDEQLSSVASAGLTTQRSSFLAWDRKTGQALSPVISWRDLRTLDDIRHYEDSQLLIQQITGLRLSAHYSASKMRWLLTQKPRLLDNPNLCLSPLASYLMYHLLQTPDCQIDHSNAQRTLLFDIHKLEWSDTLLKRFGIPEVLPTCQPVIHDYGYLKRGNIPLNTVCGDQNAALHAYPELGDKDALINIGTGAFILTAIKERLQQGRESTCLLTSLVQSDHRHAQFVSEATVNGAAAALTWFCMQQHLDANENFYKQLDKSLHQITPPGIFLNQVSGLGSPWWCTHGDSGFIPETGMDIAEKSVALIESIIFMLFHNLQQLEHPPESIFICGGLSRLDGLCQKLANLTQLPIYRYPEIEATALGCARLASPSGQIIFKHRYEQVFMPDNDALLAERYAQFVGEINKRCHNG